MKNILLVGNHTCGNRGDAAILRGLSAGISTLLPDAKVSILSRFPISSEYLLQQPVKQDVLHQYRSKAAGSFRAKVFKKIQLKFLDFLLWSKAANNAFTRTWKLPQVYQAEIAKIAEYDLVIQVGGSFFVDLYGHGQYDYAFCAVSAQIPVILAGHSLGPFTTISSQKRIVTLLQAARATILREEVSFNQLPAAAKDSTSFIIGADTAWLVPNNHLHEAPPLKRRVIAITVRELAPFDKRLGVTQADFESAVAELIDQLAAENYHIKMFSTCTGIDGYPKDDRMVALRIKKKCVHSAQVEVVMEELNDVQLGYALSQCMLTVGTRLHSAIISMNFGTPAFALNYEHKSAGVMQSLGLPQLAQPIEALFNNELFQQIMIALENLDQLTLDLKGAVLHEREKALSALKKAFSIL